MLLSAVSFLVVAQSSSEFPEGLMNNPVYSFMLSLSSTLGKKALVLLPVVVWIQIFCHFSTLLRSSLLLYRCPRRNVKYFGRVFLMLNYTDITQNTYIESWMVTEIMAREKCGHLAYPHTVRLQLYRINLESSMQPPLPVVIWLRAARTLASFTAHELRPTR